MAYPSIPGKPQAFTASLWRRGAVMVLASALCYGIGAEADAKTKHGAHKARLAAAAAKASKKKVALRLRKRHGASVAVTGATDTPNSPPARDLFGKQAGPSPLAARAIGTYARGCLAGGKMLPVDGPAWQAMRLSRNRNWGHPLLVAYVERLASEAQKLDGWPGLMVGDMAQPMGGPMLTGHASHQIGLDADIWLKPMPPKILTPEERETISADSVVANDRVSINPQVWLPGHVTLLKRAVSYPEVARIFVHPAIKKALCEAAGKDRDWLSKVRPWWGHNYHFHVRLACPSGSPGCEDQPEANSGDGCGAELESWLKRVKTPIIPTVPPVQKPAITMAQLPGECSKLVGYEPAPVIAGPPLPERKPGASAVAGPVPMPAPGKKQAVQPVSAKAAR